VEHPVLLPAEALKLRLPERTINFYSIVPLYEAEMNLKVNRGMPALTTALDAKHVSELIDLNRARVV
jgi:hypothetical protein